MEELRMEAFQEMERLRDQLINLEDNENASEAAIQYATSLAYDAWYYFVSLFDSVEEARSWDSAQLVNSSPY